MQKHQNKKYWVFLFTSVQLDKLPDNKQIRKKSSCFFLKRIFSILNFNRARMPHGAIWLWVITTKAQLRRDRAEVHSEGD